MCLFHKITGIGNPEQRQINKYNNSLVKKNQEHDQSIKTLLFQINHFRLYYSEENSYPFEKKEAKEIWFKNSEVIYKDTGKNYTQYFAEENKNNIDRQIELEKIKAENLAKEKEVIESKNKLK